MENCQAFLFCFFLILFGIPTVELLQFLTTWVNHVSNKGKQKKRSRHDCRSPLSVNKCLRYGGYTHNAQQSMRGKRHLSADFLASAIMWRRKLSSCCSDLNWPIEKFEKKYFNDLTFIFLL